MSDDDHYMGATALLGATWRQDLAIEMVDNPFIHEGLKRDLFAILGGEGFSDRQM